MTTCCVAQLTVGEYGSQFVSAACAATTSCPTSSSLLLVTSGSTHERPPMQKDVCNQALA